MSKTTLVLAVTIATATVACSDEKPTATTQVKAANNPSSSVNAAMRTLEWYREPLKIAPANAQRLEQILKAVKTEEVAAVIEITNIEQVSGESYGEELIIGRATYRVVDIWKRSASQPATVSVGFEYPELVLQPYALRSGRQLKGNMVQLEVGDQLVISGQYVESNVFPSTEYEPLIAPTSPSQPGMLIRGDEAITITDGVSVPVLVLKAAAKG